MLIGLMSRSWLEISSSEISRAISYTVTFLTLLICILSLNPGMIPAHVYSPEVSSVRFSSTFLPSRVRIKLSSLGTEPSPRRNQFPSTFSPPLTLHTSTSLLLLLPLLPYCWLLYCCCRLFLLLFRW